VLRTESDARERAKNVAINRRRRQLMLNIAIRVVSLFIVLVIWQIFGGRIDETMFTTPIAIGKAAVEMIGDGELWTYLAPSLLVLCIGLSMAAVVGVIIGLMLARFWVLDVGLGVYITFLYSIPSVALVPLIVLWAGFDITAKVIILFMFAFFPMVIWINIVLPGALPFIVTGLRLAVGRGLIGMVLADLYTAISGIGYLIVRTASTYQVDKMFVPIVTLGLLGVTLTACVRFLETRVAPWTKAGIQD